MDTLMHISYLISSMTFMPRKHPAGFVAVVLLLPMLLVLAYCATDNSSARSLPGDITTAGFLSNDCYQCIVTAKPDAGVEGLTTSRESAHINLMKSIETKCYAELFAAVLKLNPSAFGDSTMQSCAMQQLKPFVDKRILITTYFNEDYSETAVIRICAPGLKNSLTTLHCK